MLETPSFPQRDDKVCRIESLVTGDGVAVNDDYKTLSRTKKAKFMRLPCPAKSSEEAIAETRAVAGLRESAVFGQKHQGDFLRD